MGTRTQELHDRFRSFSDELIAFVEQLSDADWDKSCEWEQWTVGMTARHLGAGHFPIIDMADMIVNGRELPQLTMDQINEMSKKDAQAHADCNKDETLDLLRENSARTLSYLSGLSDGDLDRKGNMPAFGGDVSVAQLFEMVIFYSAAKHYESMQAAVK